MLVQRDLLAGGQPGYVEPKARMVGEQLQEPLALEDADPRVRHSFDAVGQRILHRALEADHVAGEQVVNDLATAVLQRLEPEDDALQERVEMRAHRALREHLPALADIDFALLEAQHELDLGRGQGTEPRQPL